MKKLLYTIAVIIFSFPIVVAASGNPGAIIPDNPGGILPGAKTDTLEGTLLGFLKLFLQVVGLIAVLFVIYGGFRYVTSNGNEKVTSAAKQTILNALIGLVVIILSYVIVNVVTNAAFGTIK